jgi:ABC-type glycerol-3-phosphate transport system permease component
MAASVIMIAPIMLLYFFTQRQFTEGVASSGLKG